MYVLFLPIAARRVPKETPLKGEEGLPLKKHLLMAFANFINKIKLPTRAAIFKVSSSDVVVCKLTVGY